jgi:alpha-L-glutamate ligase-like protein
MVFVSPKRLRELGVLGMNSRNVEYISRYNPRHLYPVVDNKLNTKKLAQENGISVPALLAVIEGQRQLRKLEAMLDPLEKFVIKPTRGSGGKGILVITGRNGESFVKANGAAVNMRDIRRHINNIIGGLYSLGGKPDSAMIEALIEYDEVFNEYTCGGAPDVRVIVFQGYPVMAMLRCATIASDGRANLHQGAIGVGIDIGSGRCLTAVQHDHPIAVHPDTGKAFSQLVIPEWQQILTLASGCFEMSGLGYIGCDIVLDKTHGPVILELNARPGLAIQIACGVGLLTRLHDLEYQELDASLTVSERVQYAQQHFSLH